MTVGDLVRILENDVIAASGDLSFAPAGVACDHRKTVPGGLFVCVSGYVVDGHQFAAGALANGAAVLVSQKSAAELGLPPGTITAGGAPAAHATYPSDPTLGVAPYPYAPVAHASYHGLRAFIQVKDSRRALAAASHLFYNGPTKKLALTGVTGTKGKTTTVYMIRSILRAAGIKTGMLGTIENDLGGEVVKAKETTPESVELAAAFSAMADNGCTHAVMEVSSQGLALSRVEYCGFETGVFTNFYKDHISPREHANIEEYFAAKLKLFSMCKNAVINADIDKFSAVRDAFLSHSGSADRLLTYSADESNANHMSADVRAHGIELTSGAGAFTRFDAYTPWFSEKLALGMPGRYNVSNALAAIAVCGLMGVSKEAIRDGLRDVFVRGRVQPVDAGQDFTVLVDYAHNAASLEALITTLREYDFRKITTLFGCGGNRARDRRFDMGEVSGRLSDFTVVTSDNPRDEDPDSIISDIETGLRRTGGSYITIGDRREAIGYAIKNAKKGELVLIAGKGHETGQTAAGRTVPFDDVAEAHECLIQLPL